MTETTNQNPEHIARDRIDEILRQAGWIIQSKAKREEEGHRLTAVEDQSKGYAGAKLKYIDNDRLPYVYESTGSLLAEG